MGMEVAHDCGFLKTERRREMATFYNQATLSYNGISTTSNIATGELVDILSVTKTPLLQVYTQGGSVVYVISLVNSGTAPLTGLTVTDNLGAYTIGAGTAVPLTYRDGSVQYYVNGILQAAPALGSTSPLTLNGISVPANGNAILLYETLVNQYAPLADGAQIENTVTVSGGGINTPVTAEATVRVDTEPLLGITKSLSPATVSENGQITYTFLIENRGNTAADASDQVSVADTFLPVLKSIAVTFNGAVWTAGTQYNYDSTTGVFVSVPGQITVPAATYAQNSTTGEWVVTPGTSTLTITGTI